jgi:hypothetical protein
MELWFAGLPFLIFLRPVRLAYQPPASSTFLSEQTSHQQSASSTFLSEQTSTSHQPPAKRTGCWFGASIYTAGQKKKYSYHLGRILFCILITSLQRKKQPCR